MTKILQIAGATLLVAWSGLALPQPPSDPQAFVRGAKGWAENCGRCHNARDPRDFRDDQWKVIMSHMRLRAGLTGQEASDILKFLQASN